MARLCRRFLGCGELHKLALSYPSAGTDDDGASRKTTTTTTTTPLLWKSGFFVFQRKILRIFWKKKRRVLVSPTDAARRQMRDARRRRPVSLCHSLSLSLSLSLSRARFRKKENKRASNSWYVFMPSSFKRKFKKRIFASKTLNHNKQKKRGEIFCISFFCSFGGRVKCYSIKCKQT